MLKSMLVALLLAGIAADVSATNTLSGQVRDENDAPIAGALVDLYTAKPRVGLATTCPSCYRDCSKSAKTDAEGRFTIMGLDSVLLFRVLVLAPERQAVLTDLIDPAEAELDVQVKPLPADLPTNRMLRGRVIDEQGKPLAGAVVWPTGAKTENRRWWGTLPGVDEASVTDAQGRFVITSQDPKLGLDLQVAAPGYAVVPSRLFELDGNEHEIQMRIGPAVSGRLTYEGKPVPNRAVGIVQRDRSGSTFVGETTRATDEDGRFAFMNLQAEQSYAIYSLCDASQDLPVLKTVSLETGGDGDVKQLGDLALVHGLTLQGRVEFPPGVEIPEGAKLRISRDPAWDWCETLLSTDGEFTIRSLPPEVYSVGIIAPGFQIDASRMRYQVIGESQFGLRLRSGGESVVRIDVPMKLK